ncbi:MAG: hypothetical protein GXY49_14000, partial [Syntrophomonadaceae bacterium]|nr:hypothetical protein [Syntrophomonadaceae bacterium]
MIGSRRNRSYTAIIVALFFIMSMIIGVPPVQAADMTVELLSPAATFISDDGSTVIYQVN